LWAGGEVVHALGDRVLLVCDLDLDLSGLTVAAGLATQRLDAGNIRHVDDHKPLALLNHLQEFLTILVVAAPLLAHQDDDLELASIPLLDDSPVAETTS